MQASGLLCGVVQRTGVKRVCLSPLVPLDQCAFGVLAGAMVRASRGVPGCPGVSRRWLWPEGRRPLTSCSCMFPHFPASAVSRTWITGLIRQLPNALNFKHAPVAASTHDLRSIRAGRVRCGAQRQESGADEVPGDAREGPRRGMGRCWAGPLAGTPAERRPQTCLRRRRAMAFPARLTRCLRKRRARRLRRCPGEPLRGDARGRACEDAGQWPFRRG